MKKLLKLSFILPVVCLLSTTIVAQKTITGTVTNDSAKVIPGVTVEIRGTTISTATSQEGIYTISAGDESVLVFRMTGFVTQEIPVNGRTQIDVVMSRSTLMLTNLKEDIRETVVRKSMCQVN